MIDEQRHPSWVEAVFDSLDVECDSPHGLRWLFDPEEERLIFAPPLVKLKGGSHDGEEVFSFYHLNVSSILMLFDELPHISYFTRDDEIHIEGLIDEAHIWITFQKEPFLDDEPLEELQ